jgi:hypothetical protein
MLIQTGGSDRFRTSRLRCQSGGDTLARAAKAQWARGEYRFEFHVGKNSPDFKWKPGPGQSTGSELELARRGGAERTTIDLIGEIKDEYGSTVGARKTEDRATFWLGSYRKYHAKDR